VNDPEWLSPRNLRLFAQPIPFANVDVLLFVRRRDTAVLEGGRGQSGRSVEPFA
jgi:hypothetical protein